MFRETKIFISHSWNDKKHYDELVNLLRSSKKLRWKNLSITVDKAIAIISGELAQDQRHELIMEQLEEIRNELRELELEQPLQTKKLYSYYSKLRELNNYQNINSLFLEAREKIAEPEFIHKIEILEKIRLKYENQDVESLIQNVTSHIKTLEHSISAMKTRSSKLLEQQEKYRIVQQDLDELKFGVTGKRRDTMITRYPNLALAIRNKIALSDVVLIIISPNIQYRGWMEFEYQEAFVLKKPLIGVLTPDTTTSLPPDLASFGAKAVSWDLNELLNNITRY